MFRLVVVATTALIFAATHAAVAAPQIMGLVATTEPVPMQCDGEECSALLSAFCLQEKRLPPDLESAYRPAGEGQVFLVVTAADGRTVRLPANGLIQFSSRYGYTAVEARLSLERLAGVPPAALAVEVAPLAALIPVEKAGDPHPLTREEIAIATGPWRLAAEAVMEGNSDESDSVRTVMRLVNALPAAGDITPENREPLWERAGPGAPSRARQVFDACLRTVDQAISYPLRRCLEERHEEMQIKNTRLFWRSLGGS